MEDQVYLQIWLEYLHSLLQSKRCQLQLEEEDEIAEGREKDKGSRERERQEKKTDRLLSEGTA